MENIILGIDISSKTLDICVKSTKNMKHFKISNSKKAIRSFFKPFQNKQVFIAMENTGRFNWELYDILPEFNFKVYVLNPLHLSKSQGLVRGKCDQSDAYRIAIFLEKNEKELTPWKPSSKNIRKLQVLLTERNARIKSKRRLKKQSYDYQKMKELDLNKSLSNWNQQQIKQLDKQIEKIEEMMTEIINQDKTLKKQEKLMLSIPGVGKVLCWTILAKTEAFSKIKDPRKMACYSGVVPFKHESGTSIYRKPRVSIFADKQMKAILHLAAMSAIRLNNDLRVYYQRKVNEGKNKMSVLNAVRNKIIHIIFAVIKSEKLFQNRLVMS